jgi:hypothetical protein
VIVVMPPGPLVVVVWNWAIVVVVVVAAGPVVVVVADVPVLVTPVGSNTTGLSLDGVAESPAAGTAGPLGGGADALELDTVASVASTVASTTPDPARMASARDWVREPSSGGAIWSGPVGSVTAHSLA